ncbi:MAG: aldehyde dehydrogenase family protein, partial [Gammaproteobacteria bacterium]|nr:aldehyde dehydrogenase family protein [Gammaproteobacteria bacterium]
PGVVNILHGYGADIGQAMVDHPALAAISFTGGTATGKKIASSTAAKFKKLSLEMGGKNPTVIFADCDWEKTLTETLRASFANQGEICLCGSRILVEQEIFERFRDEFVTRTQQLVVGDPLSDETDQGALISAGHKEKVLACIHQARADGGEILCGGKAVTLSGRCADGWFVAPTVISGLSPDCKTNQQEIFGPVVSIMPFESEQEAIDLANNSEYGLAASVWSNDINRCMRVAGRIEAGLIWVNTWMLRDLRTPLGGMKQSGAGREGGFESMRFFTETKNVCVKYD